MPREALRQRIRYLLEHGEIYPTEPTSKTNKAMLWLLALIAVCDVLEIICLLR